MSKYYALISRSACVRPGQGRSVTSDSAHVACYVNSNLTTANTCVRVSVVSGVVCRIFTISADPVDTAADMLAKGLGMSVACVR